MKADLSKLPPSLRPNYARPKECVIRQIGMRVRENLLAMLDSFESDEHLTGLCAIASIGMMKSLMRHGFKAKLIEGTFGPDRHVWNMVGSLILDITKTQYAPAGDAVFIGAWDSPQYTVFKIWDSPQRADESTWVSDIELDWDRIISVPKLGFQLSRT